MTIGSVMPSIDSAALLRPNLARPDATAAAASGTDQAGREQVGRSGPSAAPDGVDARQCRTCAERKFKDVSNDPSVSFQTPTSVAPGAEAAAVSAHEQEHVRNNAARAEAEGMDATSTVSIHTDVCPECGRVYVSGGTTTTTYTRRAQAASDAPSTGQWLRATA